MTTTKVTKNHAIERTEDYGIDKITLEIFNDPKAKKSNWAKWVMGGIVVTIVALIGAITVAYILSPTVHSFFNHTFSHIQNGKLSVPEGMLFIALPVGASALLLGLAIHLYKKYQQAKNNEIEDGNALLRLRNVLGEAIKKVIPTKRQLRIGGVALGVIGLLAGTLALSGFLVFHFVPAANHWLYAQALPTIQNGLQYKIQIWEGLAYIGGATAAATLLTGLAIHIFQKIADRRKEHECITKHMSNIDTFDEQLQKSLKAEADKLKAEQEKKGRELSENYKKEDLDL